MDNLIFDVWDPATWPAKTRPILTTGEIYHVYNKGVENRLIFLDDNDRFRFIHDLYEFNDADYVVNINYRFTNRLNATPPVHKKRKLLVEILAFSLMHTHFHLILKQYTDDGISKFMHKLGTGYTNYINTKIRRKGALFQGRYKARHISNESYFAYIPHYIHLNPLDLINIKWREGKATNVKEAMEYLNSYRWSSYQDYIGKKNFPSLTNRELYLKIYNGEIGYKKVISDWLNSMI